MSLVEMIRARRAELEEQRRQAEAEKEASLPPLDEDELTKALLNAACAAVQHEFASPDRKVYYEEQSKPWAKIREDCSDPSMNEVLDALYAEAQRILAPRGAPDRDEVTAAAAVPSPPSTNLPTVNQTQAAPGPRYCAADERDRHHAMAAIYEPEPPPLCSGDTGLPAPTAWSVQMYGPARAAEMMRSARHPEETAADFAERVRDGRRAARAAERFAERARVAGTTNDDAGWMER